MKETLLNRARMWARGPGTWSLPSLRQRARRPLTHPARPRSIKALLAMLFVVPLASLLGLWGFAASITLLSAIQEHNFTTEDQLYGQATQMLGLDLAQERGSSFAWLSSGGTRPPTSLLAQRRATDAAVAAFERGVNAHPRIILPAARPALARLLTALGTLSGIRAAMDSGRLSALSVFQEYNTLVDDQFRLYRVLIVVNDVTLYRQAAASVEAGQAVELADREVALVDGALAARGQMTKSERTLFAQTVGERRLAMNDALAVLDPAMAAGYRNAYTSPAYAAFVTIEDKIIASVGSSGPIPVNPRTFQTTSFSLLAALGNAEGQDRMGLSGLGTRVGNQLLLKVLLAGGAGLVAVLLSVVLMARFGRRINRDLTDLQHAALELATERLPYVVERLSHGEEVGVPAEPDLLLPGGRISEITKVAEAFSSVQRTAVEAAAGQARLRRGVSQVFRNLAWRSQSLLHRQLALLDGMERRSTEAETLEELFKLDHLTTRMRRHAEGLIILSGAAPGRAWSAPVPLVDVVRAAVAEVEDYTRVSVVTLSVDAVVGSAVADVIHLLAELIENATTNSPARTEVTVRAERVAHGIVVEIEDRGMGLSDEEIEAVNSQLTNPPEFDLADSDKLGFFVVARLAARHEIKITLRPSPYGGVTAIVLLSHAITIRNDADTDSPDRLSLPAGTGLAGTGLTGAGLARAGIPDAGRAIGQADPWEADAGQAAGANTTIVVAAESAAEPAADGQIDQARGEHPAAAVGSDQGTWLFQAPVDANSNGSAVTAGPQHHEAEPDAAPLTTEPAPDEAALSAYPELPRRVRDANLHPELRNSAMSSVGQPSQEAAQERTPVESGALFASLQQGWERGRTEAEQTDNGSGEQT